MEEGHLLGYLLFDEPAAGILSDKLAWGDVEIVGDKEGGRLAAVAGQDQLADLSFVVAQGAPAVVDAQLATLALFSLHFDRLPLIVGNGVGVLDEVLAAPTEGQELDLFRLIRKKHI